MANSGGRGLFYIAFFFSVYRLAHNAALCLPFKNVGIVLLKLSRPLLCKLDLIKDSDRLGGKGGALSSSSLSSENVNKNFSFPFEIGKYVYKQKLFILGPYYYF